MSGIVFGEVVRAGDGVLTVLADGLQLSAQDILVEAQLAAGLDNPIVPDRPLQPGDQILLGTQDGQTYALICKVVRYG